MDKYCLHNLCDNLWACYILKSINDLSNNKTYIGSTNSTKRRIRQHNREIVGGAKATAFIYPAEMYCIITGFMNHQSTLRCEWLLKHPDGKKKINNKYRGIDGKIKGLNNLILYSEKWSKKSENANLTIWIHDKYYHLLDYNNYPVNIKIIRINNQWNDIYKLNLELDNDLQKINNLLSLL